MEAMEKIPAKEKIKEVRKGEPESGRKEDRERKITENTGLVYSIIKRFAGRGCEMEDLFQIGMIGLIKAVDHFDDSFQVKFSTYAVPLITGEIKRFLRDNSVLHVSRTLKENGWKAKKAAAELALKLGREATLAELAAAVEMDTEELVIALEANMGVESLQKTVFGKDGKEVSLMEQIGDGSFENGVSEHGCYGNGWGDAEKEKVLDRMVLRQVLEGLEPRERKLIRMRYFLECTQAEIAAELGVSQVQVSRLEKKILGKMRGSWELPCADEKGIASDDKKRIRNDKRT